MNRQRFAERQQFNEHLDTLRGNRAPVAKVAQVALAVMSGERTLRDIANRTGIDKSTVHACLGVLREAGVVTWHEGHRRTLAPLVTVVAHTPPDRASQTHGAH